MMITEMWTLNQVQGDVYAKIIGIAAVVLEFLSSAFH